MLSLAARDSRLPFWGWAALPLLVGAWLRLRGIGGPEPFVDEGANILTALDPRVHEAFEPLAQGRPWLAYLFQPAGWFPAQALVVARLMAVGAGLATLAALGWTLHQLAGRVAAMCGLALWAVLPFAVFHERLALQDPFVTALLAWAVALLTAGSLRGEKCAWPWFLAAGGLFGGAFLLKISAAFALPWLGLVYLAVQRQTARPLFVRRLIFIALGALAPVLTLGRDLGHLGNKLDRYSALPSLAAPDFLAAAAERLKTCLGWYAGYAGWPLLWLLVLALVLAGRGRHYTALTCALGWLVSVLITGLCYNHPYARYLLPDQLPLILFLALAAGSALGAGRERRWLTWALLLPALAGWGLVAWTIGAEPVRAAVPADEIEQYFTGPWSGRGVNAVRRFLTDYADLHGVSCLVLTHRFLRPGCYGLMLAELGDPRIGVVPFTLYEPAELAAIRPSLRQASAGKLVAFFLLYEGSNYPPPPWLDQANGPAHRVQQVPRGAGEAFTLYQFEP